MNPIIESPPHSMEQEMEILMARIEEKMIQIRRDREEGERLTSQAREISRANAQQLEELRQAIARML